METVTRYLTSDLGRNRLNRTMQYGNYEHLNANEEDEEGLNRTMQYGNEEHPEYRISAVGRFKSYYVVWKL